MKAEEEPWYISGKDLNVIIILNIWFKILKSK